MAKHAHVAGMSSIPRAFVRTPNSRVAVTIHAKLFRFTRVKRVHTRVHTHAYVKFKVSGTVANSNFLYSVWYLDRKLSICFMYL